MNEIDHSERLADLFGHWPDFHDAELRAVRLLSPGARDASVEVDVEVAEMSNEIDERGYYRDRVRAVVTLHFEHAQNVAISEFRSQNVLDAMLVELLSPAERAREGDPWGERRLRVTFVPIPAFCAMTLLCDRASVVQASIVARTS